MVDIHENLWFIFQMSKDYRSFGIYKNIGWIGIINETNSVMKERSCFVSNIPQSCRWQMQGLQGNCRKKVWHSEDFSRKNCVVRR
jgi:hypothetical protein